ATTTRKPARARSCAVALPAGPAPAIRTSADSLVLEPIEQEAVGIEAGEGQIERAFVSFTVPGGERGGPDAPGAVADFRARKAFDGRMRGDHAGAARIGAEPPVNGGGDHVSRREGDFEALPFSDERRGGRAAVAIVIPGAGAPAGAFTEGDVAVI